MAYPVRTKRLASGQVAATVPSATTTVYTCPEGETAIVKSMVLHAPDGAMTPSVQVLLPAGLGMKIWRPVLAADDPGRLEFWWVLHPGDQVLVVQPANSGRLRYFLSGTELEGTAD